MKISNNMKAFGIGALVMCTPYFVFNCDNNKRKQVDKTPTKDVFEKQLSKIIDTTYVDKKGYTITKFENGDSIKKINKDNLFSEVYSTKTPYMDLQINKDDNYLGEYRIALYNDDGKQYFCLDEKFNNAPTNLKDFTYDKNGRVIKDKQGIYAYDKDGNYTYTILPKGMNKCTTIHYFDKNGIFLKTQVVGENGQITEFKDRVSPKFLSAHGVPNDFIEAYENSFDY